VLHQFIELRQVAVADEHEVVDAMLDHRARPLLLAASRWYLSMRSRSWIACATWANTAVPSTGTIRPMVRLRR
jgi:hypothetical protein